ncbi:toll/interleukin-1 receptor domain-containing protein [uncultured Methanobrevibacter sp.]|uniref:toll/interleukin-1 receptor domain-containing protein n=1 Tax=uncultured Methanobrevibacter sp. TaxID=253161 RepID=UPI002632DFE8|nr:toll/interleukin-1 receptor domain-containing protein [uncultured Methanobrevibacter sp.]
MGLFDRVLGKNKKQDGERHTQVSFDDNSPGGHDIFISYSTRDKDIADAVCHLLEQNGHECWIAPRNIKSGENYAPQINDAIKSARLFVLIYSRNAQESNFVKNEVGIAYQNGIALLPFMIDESLPEDDFKIYLKNIHWISAFPDVENHFEELVLTVEQLSKPSEIQTASLPAYQQDHIHIIYSTRDKQIADRVCYDLEQNGFRCWIAPRDILAGKNYAIQLNDSIKNASLALLIFSKHSMESEFANNEVSVAFENNVPIISFKIDDHMPEGNMSFYLTFQNWLEAYPDPERVLPTLVEDVGKLLDLRKSESDLKVLNDKSSLNECIDEIKNMDFARFRTMHDNRHLGGVKIFISYSEHDAGLAEEMCRGFEALNAQCWFKDRDYMGGDASQIIHAIDESDLMIVIYSGHSKDSGFVASEVNIAFKEEIPIFAFAIDESELDGNLKFFLENKQWINAYPDCHAKSQQLFSDCLKLLGTEQSSGEADDSSLLKKPFKAYKGDEPFIFISYAHRDAQLVFSEIRRFHDEGYPIWYDQGLTPGQEWDDEIALALIGCSLLVVFISKNSMASKNVHDEIKMALNRDIDIVPIYLEKTELPPALELRLSTKQAIRKYNYDSDDYLSDCFKAFDKAGIPKIDFNDD